MDFAGVPPNKFQRKLAEFLAQARAIDYQAVFIEDITDRISIPDFAAMELENLIADLQRYNFSQMPEDVIGTVFQELIPTEERHTLGQYFTSTNLADLVLGFCVRSPKNTVIDPTCGTGTFLVRAYDMKHKLGGFNHLQLLSQIWGVDIAAFPASSPPSTSLPATSANTRISRASFTRIFLRSRSATSLIFRRPGPTLIPMPKSPKPFRVLTPPLEISRSSGRNSSNKKSRATRENWTSCWKRSGAANTPNCSKTAKPSCPARPTFTPIFFFTQRHSSKAMAVSASSLPIHGSTLLTDANCRSSFCANSNSSPFWKAGASRGLRTAASTPSLQFWNAVKTPPHAPPTSSNL